jgi:tRNA-modifying protein YgfZ
MATTKTWLSDRGVVRVEGDEAAGFLQGLLTNDVEGLEPGEARYAALLTPQGKILFDMLVVRVPFETGPAFRLDCAAAQSADLAKRLGFYKLRAKVSVADASLDCGVVAVWDDKPGPGAIVYADPRASRLGWRVIMPRAEAEAIGEADLPAYERLRIRSGVPKGGIDFAYADAFPHDADLDLLNGVDFRKGCYVGQEVVARMKHRGTIRKRVVRVTLSGGAPPPGTPVLDGELPVGALGSSSGREALAMLRLDRVEEAKAAGRGLSAGGAELALVE